MSETQKTFMCETTVRARAITASAATWDLLEQIKGHLDRKNPDMAPATDSEALRCACEIYLDDARFQSTPA